MLSVLLLTALVATPPASVEPQIPTKEEITKAFKMLEENTNAILRQLPDRLGVDPSEKKLGVTMETRELGLGPDGLPTRHTYVTGVFVPSGAFAAGVLPGDRIVAIGDKELQTELPRAVMFYIEDYPDGIPITLERAGRRFPVTLHRAQLSCAASVWNAFNVEVWRGLVEKLRGLIRRKIAAIEAVPMLTQEQHTQACIDVIETLKLIRGNVIKMKAELEPSLSPLCTVQRATP